MKEECLICSAPLIYLETERVMQSADTLARITSAYACAVRFPLKIRQIPPSVSLHDKLWAE